MIRYLSLGIANLINAFNPELLLLGGWSGSKFLPHIQALIASYAMQ